jgi:hypothetical protein
MSNKNLKERLEAFAKGLDGAACIDDLALTPQQSEKNRADYFFNNREIICELKTLEKDASPKIKKVLEPYERSPQWPAAYGAIGLQQILDLLPSQERDKIMTEIIDAITDVLDGIIEKANRQIRHTKATFDLSDSGGLLIVLNDYVDVLSPDLINYRVKKCLDKRLTPGGEIRFPHIDFVLVINTAHYMQVTPVLRSLPILLMPTGRSHSQKIAEFINPFISQWATFEGRPLIKLGDGNLSVKDFKEIRWKTNQE